MQSKDSRLFVFLPLFCTFDRHQRTYILFFPFNVYLQIVCRVSDLAHTQTSPIFYYSFLFYVVLFREVDVRVTELHYHESLYRYSSSCVHHIIVETVDSYCVLYIDKLRTPEY